MRSLFNRFKVVGGYFAERREADRFQPEGWETAEGRALLNQYRADGVGRGAADLNSRPPAAALNGRAGPLNGRAGPLNGRAAELDRRPPAAGHAGWMPPAVPEGRVFEGEITGQIPKAELAAPNPAPTAAGRGVARVGPPAAEALQPPAPARHRSHEVAGETDHRPRHDGTQEPVGAGFLLSRAPTTRHGEPLALESAKVMTITNIVRAPDGSRVAGAIVTISLFADRAAPGFRPESTIDGVARIITPEEGEQIAGWTADGQDPAD
jgi:hypothetical protein